ncbi:hypothetical protein [uncultured Roseovarius sp.]|uniref:hypothetical protein n=1 Tax=uncultured Roseovarius sp. TaxID=293344 RepID=UPI0025F76DE4|nr:hypothetical protein [uncultured Roseovarius sp.]
MLKFPHLALGLAVAMLAGTADAQHRIAPKLQNTGAVPPANHQGQWWTHPLGCEYSRAGLPGESVWYIIVNTDRKGCPRQIVVKSLSGVY